MRGLVVLQRAGFAKQIKFPLLSDLHQSLSSLPELNNYWSFGPFLCRAQLRSSPVSLPFRSAASQEFAVWSPVPFFSKSISA